MSRFLLPAQLTKDSVMPCWQQLQQLVANHATLTLDAEKVTQFDCAGLALLLELRFTHPNLAIVNLTPAITNLCQLYQIEL